MVRGTDLSAHHPTPFLPSGEIDREGVANIIETGITGCSQVSLRTYGDSQFDFLSDDEVAQLHSLAGRSRRRPRPDRQRHPPLARCQSRAIRRILPRRRC